MMDEHHFKNAICLECRNRVEKGLEDIGIEISDTDKVKLLDLVEATAYRVLPEVW